MAASEREIFELLYEMLRGYYQSLVDGALRVNGVFLIAAGWILTSPTPLTYLEAHPSARRSAIAFVLLAHGVYLVIGLRAFALSRATAYLLDDLHYMPARYYGPHRIRPLTLLVWYLTNLIVVGGIIAALRIRD